MASVIQDPSITTATPSMDETTKDWHTVTISVPFPSAHYATIAKRVILVDRELNQHLVHRELQVNAKTNTLEITYSAATVRLLRLATNGFIDNLNLVIRTMHEFAPEE